MVELGPYSWSFICPKGRNISRFGSQRVNPKPLYCRGLQIGSAKSPVSLCSLRPSFIVGRPIAKVPLRFCDLRFFVLLFGWFAVIPAILQNQFLGFGDCWLFCWAFHGKFLIGAAPPSLPSSTNNIFLCLFLLLWALSSKLSLLLSLSLCSAPLPSKPPFEPQHSDLEIFSISFSSAPKIYHLHWYPPPPHLSFHYIFLSNVLFGSWEKGMGTNFMFLYYLVYIFCLVAENRVF